LSAPFTFQSKIQASEKDPPICDETIAQAMAKEQSDDDGVSQLTAFLARKVKEAALSTPEDIADLPPKVGIKSQKACLREHRSR
jgi:hypothetical protein